MEKYLTALTSLAINPKRNQSWIFIGRTDDDAKAPIFLPPDVKSQFIGKILMLGKTEGRRRTGNRGWDSWMVSSTQWTWAWENSRIQWRTEKPGVLQIMGSQKVRHDLATEQQQTKVEYTQALWTNNPILGSYLKKSESWDIQKCSCWDYL